MRKTPRARPFDRKTIDAYRYGRIELSPWAARIVGIKNGILQRQFEEKYKNYDNSNTSGNRGIEICYFLAPGIYEINRRLSFSQARRYFLRVIDGETAIEISREEVLQCLKIKNT